MRDCFVYFCPFSARLKTTSSGSFSVQFHFQFEHFSNFIKGRQAALMSHNKQQFNNKIPANKFLKYFHKNELLNILQKLKHHFFQTALPNPWKKCAKCSKRAPCFCFKFRNYLKIEESPRKNKANCRGQARPLVFLLIIRPVTRSSFVFSSDAQGGRSKTISRLFVYWKALETLA